VLVELLRGGSEARESATVALHNLAINNSVNAAAIVRAGALPLLMEGGRYAASALKMVNTSLYSEAP
jgi:hypothetical protein